MPSIEKKLMDDAERVAAVKRLAKIMPSSELADSENLVYLLMCCPHEQVLEVLRLFNRADALRGEV